jgi:magnesium chelatase subunit I
LKDRIGSQILTHYPDSLEVARTITEQETSDAVLEKGNVYVPELAKNILEQISFEARKSEFVDAKSGVSARLSISAFQNLLSTAERRALQNGDEKTTVRLSDFMGIIPAITGKIELVYEGEQEGANEVAKQLIADAIVTQFLSYFPKIEKLTKDGDNDPYEEIVGWFFEESGGFELLDSLDDDDYQLQLDRIEPMDDLLSTYVPDISEKDMPFFKEFVLWALVELKKLSKYNLSDGIRFKDIYGGYISGL